MDDFVLILKNKQDCVEIKKIIEKFLSEVLQLELNDKTKYYPYQMGVNFCGYRIFCTHRLLRTSSKKKIKRTIKGWNKLYDKKKLDLNFAMQSLNSWKGHASHCNSYNLQKQVIDSCKFIYNDFTYQTIEAELIEDMNLNNT